MTSKREQIKQYIQAQGEGFQVTPHMTWVLASDFECARSTVYAALRDLKAIGAMNENNVYTARFVRPAELLAALFDESDQGLNYCLLTDKRRSELCSKLYTTPRLLYQALEWASCYMIVDSTFYGMSYRRNERAIA